MEKRLRETLPAGRFEHVSSTRSRVMGAIRSKRNRTTEQRLRYALVRAGVSGWTLHPDSVPGRPDFYFANQKLAVFVDGCFWHGCALCGHVPKTNSVFWSAKITRNKERDRRTIQRLRNLGVQTLRIWEHELRASCSAVVARISVMCTI
jgi:DNA mismatch endonuclease Vsr